jgi:hypothetical protein
MTTSRLHIRLQVALLVAAASTFIVLALLAPGVLLLEPGIATASLVESAWTVPTIVILSAGTTVYRLRRFGPALRALELGEGDVPGVDSRFIQRLHALPLTWVLQIAFQAVFVWLLTTLPALRPSLIDAQTQISFVLLATTVIGATSLPLYVAARALVGQTMEAAPWRVVEAALKDIGPPDDELEPRPLAERVWRWFRVRGHSRVRGRLANAVALAYASSRSARCSSWMRTCARSMRAVVATMRTRSRAESSSPRAPHRVPAATRRCARPRSSVIR